MVVDLVVYKKERTPKLKKNRPANVMVKS